MIGQCSACKDPTSDLKVDKNTKKVYCTNDGCGAEKTDITQFAVQAMLSNKEYLESAPSKSNTLPCGKCNGDTASSLGKVEMDKDEWANAPNDKRYQVVCTVCSTPKDVTSFMLNALIETEKG